MISNATQADGPGIRVITAEAGVFTQPEIDALAAVWQEHLSLGSEQSGYHFLVERDRTSVIGYACYGYRDLSGGVFDLYFIAVDPSARRKGVGRRVLAAAEQAARRAGGRMMIAETSGAPLYEPTRKFYLGVGYQLEATIRDFYGMGDDLAIFVKRFADNEE